MKQKYRRNIFLTFTIAFIFVIPCAAVTDNIQIMTSEENIFFSNENLITFKNSDKVTGLYSAGINPFPYSRTERSIRTLSSKYEILDLDRVIGDTFYAYNVHDQGAVIPQGPVKFQSDTPGVITSLKITSCGSFISGGTWAGDTWYGCEYGWYGIGAGQIWTIDEITGDMTLIGGGPESLNGLAYDPLTGVMYGCSGTDLYIINMSNGNQTLVGPFVSSISMIGIAFDGEGRLYGEGLDDTLCIIDISTGHSTIIGPLGINLNYAQDMAFDIDNNILYLAAFTLPNYESGLYICNVTTGVCTLVGNFQGNAEIAGFAIPYTPNLPPETPECPVGPSEGIAGATYTFSTKTTDPDGHQVYYNWDWGDDVYSGWLGPYNPAETVYASHSWMENGTYTVKVQAKDIYNRKSDWSDAKTIHIVKQAIIEIDNITGGLFKVKAVIRNTGDVPATGINWSINLGGGLILLGKETSGRMMGIPAGEEVIISSRFIFGFGKPLITVSAVTSGSSDTAMRNASVFLFYIKLIDG